MRAGRSQGGNCRLRRTSAVHLFRERSPAVADDGPGDGLEEECGLPRLSGRRALRRCRRADPVKFASAPAAINPMI